jgi:hypothetical protein
MTATRHKDNYKLTPAPQKRGYKQQRTDRSKQNENEMKWEDIQSGKSNQTNSTTNKTRQKHTSKSKITAFHSFKACEGEYQMQQQKLTGQFG